MDARKAEKPTVPHIPQPSGSCNQDVSALLREVFHDVLEEAVLAENVVANWTNHKVDSIGDRRTAHAIHSAIEKSQLEFEALQIVEKKLALTIDVDLEREKHTHDDPSANERTRLKRDLIFPHIDPGDAREYGLITGKDLLPSKMQQSLDFTYDGAARRVAQKTALKLPTIRPPGPARPAPSAAGAARGRPPNDVLTSKQDMKAWRSICRRDAPATRSSLAPQPIDAKHFRLDKTELVFSEYKPHVVYKRRFRLQNISAGMQTVDPPAATAKGSGCFRVVPQFDAQTLRLCPGMSAAFVVYFRTDTYLDVDDAYEVNGHTVKLTSRRDPPNLMVFLLRPTWPQRRAVYGDLHMWRVQALNTTVDCGSCFVGERLTAYLILKNNGGRGRFFIMTELQWSAQEIDTLHESLQLEFGAFVIAPNYFELDRDAFIVLQVDFYGAKSGTCIENVCLVCDNISWENIDFVADAIVFDRYTVTLDRALLLTTFTLESIASALHVCDATESCASLRSERSTRHSVTVTEARNTPPSLPSPPRVRVEDAPPDSEEAIGTDMPTSSVDIIDEVIFDYLLGIEKEAIANADDADAEEAASAAPSGVLYFGKLLGYESVAKTIKIYNNSMINLKYRWELQPISKSNYKELQLEDMNVADVTFRAERVDGAANCLPAYGQLECSVDLAPKTTAEAFYAISMGLVIEDVPQCALQLRRADANFKIVRQPRAGAAAPAVDVQVALIDVICCVQGVRILVTPRNIFGSHAHAYGAVVRRDFSLIVDCDHPGELPGQWTSNAACRALVHPEHFHIRPRLPKAFAIEYRVRSYESALEQISVAIATHYTRTIALRINVEPPRLRFDRRTLNIGCLTCGNTYEHSFVIVNKNAVRVDWEIREQFAKGMEIPGKNPIEISARNLSCGDVRITYRVTANAPRRWSSHLALLSVRDDKVVEESRLRVLYEIVAFACCVHTDFSECSILCPSEVLHVGCARTYALCFHNLTQARAVYEFADAYGHNARHFDFAIAPAHFDLPVGGARRVDVTITATMAGIFDEMFLAFNELDASPYRVDEYNPPPPTVVTVMAAVDDIYVKVVLPNGRQLYWPPRDESSMSDVWRGPDARLYEYPQGSCENDDDDTMRSLSEIRSDAGWAAPSADFGESEDACGMDTLPPDLARYLRSMEPLAEKEGETAAKPAASAASSSFSSDTTTPSAPSCRRMEECTFDDMAECVVELCNVPLRRIYTTRITLENQTPVHGVLQMEALNFPPRAYQRPRMDAVLHRLNYLSEEDEWERKLGPHGIAVQLSYADAGHELKPFGKGDIALTIYANTWGTYKENLLIDLNNILPLKISLIIDVVGVPLEFPIGVNNVHKTTILRFGTLPYKADFEMRHLLVRNVSVLPVTVVWHIFMRHTQEEIAKQPVTILFDVYHPYDDNLRADEASSRGNLAIVHGKCVGRSEHRIFKMFPQEMRIAPKQAVAIRLGVNTKAFAASYTCTEIEAYLVGYVYLSTELRHSPLLYRRRTGHDNTPVKAKLTATLDLPTLKLEMSSNDGRFSFYADRVLGVHNLCAKQVCHLTLTNHHQVAAAVRVGMEPPFVLEACRANGATCALPPTTEQQQPLYSVVVQPGDSVQLAVSFTLERDELVRIANCLYDDLCDDVTYYPMLDQTAHTFNLVKYLHFEQRGFVRQCIPMQLVIFFPTLSVPDSLNFGDVYIGNVAKLICTMRNASMCKVEFKVEESKNFHVAKQADAIESGRAERPSVYDLHVVFIPQMQGKFEEKIVIRTQLPSLSFAIRCLGYGIQNERAFVPDTC